MTDRVVSRYRVLELLGEGGMGAVYKAEDTRLKRTVALKFLPPDLTGTAEQADRFLREAQAAAALDHPNICTVYEIDEADGVTFLAMAYLEGESLEDRIRKGPLPLEAVYEIGKQAAEGLAAAHAAGVVHRDIKPSNIMLGEDLKGRSAVTLMDFGLAQVSGASKLTKVDTRMGTTAYMSPEQSLGETVGPPSDLWSLGVVIFEAVTGELPFKGHYDQAVLYSILNEEPTPITSLRSRVPMELEWIVDKCLAKDPGERYQDARELVVDLDRLQQRSASGRTTVQRIDGQPAVPPPDDAGAPTKPGRDPAAAPTGSGESAATKLRLALANRGVRVAVAAVALAAMFVAGLLLPAGAPDERPQLRRFTLRPARSLLGEQSVRTAAISPDGRHIAFTTTGSRGSIWLQSLDRHDPIEIEGVTGARQVFWAPDSNSIGFVSSAGVGKVALRGRAVTLLVEESGLALASAAWTADGQSIAYVPAIGPPMRISALGGVPRELLADGPRRRAISTSPSFVATSNGGQILLYSERTSEGGVVVARRMDGDRVGEPVRLVEGHAPSYAPSGHLLYQPAEMSAAIWAVGFSPDTLELSGEAFIAAPNGSAPSISSDGTLVYTDNSSVDPKRLVWVNRNGTVVGTIGREQAWIAGPRLAPTGDRVLASGGTGREYDLWVHEANRPVLNRVTFDSELESGAIWSPDGRSVAFTQRGSSELKLVTVGGGTMATVIHAQQNGAFTPLDWSRDGRYILYQQRHAPATGRPPGGPEAVTKDGSMDMMRRLRTAPTSISYLERVGDGWESRPFLPEQPYIVDDAVFSPDGRFVAYESNESGDFEVYVRPFADPGQRWQISSDGGRMARWSFDGDELYFQRDDTLYAVAVETGESFRHAEPDALFSRESLLGMRRYSTYDVGPDGNFVVVGRAGDEPETGIRIVLNWYEEFRDR